MAERNDPRLDRLRRALRERGSRLPPGVLRLARQVAGDTDWAMSHQECRDAMPKYAEAELAGEDVAKEYHAVKQHLDLCDDCSAQYTQLLELVLAERTGEISVPETIPTPNLDFLDGEKAISFSEFVKQKSLAVLTVLAPDQALDFDSVADVFFRRVESMGGRFSLQRGSVRAMSFGSSELGVPLYILAVNYAVTRKLIDSFSAAQIETLAAQDLLAQQVAQSALDVAREFGVPSKLAGEIASQIAIVIAAEPTTLRRLAERRT